MNIQRKPARWQDSDVAIKAVQVAFDVEESVLEAVRRAAFAANRSTSDQVRFILGLVTSGTPKRPRLTVSLTVGDYEILARRYGLSADERLAIKEKAVLELVDFSNKQGG